MIKPLGFYVLIEMVKVEQTTEGGIFLPENLVNREQEATDTGYVRAIGPTAFHGYPGCDRFDEYSCDLTPLERASGVTSASPHGCWGLEIGQKVEYRRYEGKQSAVAGYENFRYIPDSHIIGVIDDE